MGKIIGYGARGEDVTKLQNALLERGYKLNVDGIFGPQTESALKSFQKDNGLDVDGLFGDKSSAVLYGNTSGFFDKALDAGAVITGGVSGNKNNTDNSYPAFNYQQSDVVNEAYDALNTHLGTKPTQTEFQYNDQLNAVITDILNGKKFSYDLNGDALYQQYKDKYIQQGKMAMMDTMGQAAAMTGGYGNSYAQSVGQQAYQAQLQNLNDIVPELWQMAYDQYNNERQDLYNQYGLLSDREKTEYDRYRDELTDWQTDRGYLQDVANDERTFDYGVQGSEWQSGYDIHRDAIEDALAKEALEYEKERDTIKDEQWQKEFDALYGEDDNLLASLTPQKETKGGEGGTKAEALPDISEAAKPATAIPDITDGTLRPAKMSIGAIKNELNDLIKNGAEKSEINNYLREALKAGHITQAQYNELKETYAPRGNTYR